MKWPHSAHVCTFWYRLADGAVIHRSSCWTCMYSRDPLNFHKKNVKRTHCRQVIICTNDGKFLTHICVAWPQWVKSPEHQQAWYCLMWRIMQHVVFLQSEFHPLVANQIQDTIQNVNTYFITFNRRKTLNSLVTWSSTKSQLATSNPTPRLLFFHGQRTLSINVIPALT